MFIGMFSILVQSSLVEIQFNTNLIHVDFSNELCESL